MVDVLIRPQFEPEVDEHPIRRAAQATLHHQGVREDAALCVAIVDDVEMQALNLQYRGVDAPTDVLSFATHDDAPSQDAPGPGSTFVVAPEQEQEISAYLGDVIVAFPQVVAQAAQQGHGIERELRLLVVHGVLHLLGYDHATAPDEARMWAIQDQILGSLEQMNDAQALD
jgi:probable rRNA maturation factor